MRACASGSSRAYGISTPIRRICPDCCARAASGHAAVEPPTSVMKSRRLMERPLRTDDCILSHRPALEAKLCGSVSTAVLFDHLVGELLQVRRNFEAERLGGLEIDDELKSGGKLYRQIGRLRAFENLVNQSGSAFVHVGQVRLVAHETTSFNAAPLPKHSGQPIADRELCDLTVDERKHGIGRHD